MEEAALRKLIRATLGLAFVAAFSLASTTYAGPILDFTQATPGNVNITSTNVGNNTTLAVTSPTNVAVGKVVGQTAPPGTQYVETFTLSSTTAPSGSDGNITQGGFSGSFSYALPGVGGAVQVAGNVTGGILTTVTNGAGGTTVNFNTSNVQFTTIAPAILLQAFGSTTIPLSSLIGTFQLALTPASPNLTGLNFTASAGGAITAQSVPEPASVVMASMALVAGLGGVGVRRIKASRA